MRVKEDSVGLFWTDAPKQRRTAAPSQPVVMKPYQARAPLQYEIATREELIAGAGGTMVFDVECFENFFLIAFKNIATKKITTLTAPFNAEQLKWIMQHYTCVGFNSAKYDLLLIWMAYANQNMELLKQASNDIIGVTSIEDSANSDVLKVTLNSSDIEWASEVGKQRTRSDLVNKRGYEGHSERDDIIAAAGELAFCRAMGIEWPAHVNTFKSKPDVFPDIEVKTASAPHYNLILSPRDDYIPEINRFCIHVTTATDIQNGSMEFTFLIQGWWDNTNARKDGWIQAPNNRPPAHFIPLNNLNRDFSKWMTPAGIASKTVVKQFNRYMRPVDVISAYDITMRPCDHIDLIEVCPLRGSLKLYAGRLHAKRILDLPWAGNQSLEDWQIPITQDYCICDLDDTELLFNNLKEQMQLRIDLSKEYKEDLRSKSDAQIAEAIITSELFRLTRKRPKWPQVEFGTVHKFIPPDNLYFQSDYMKEVLKAVTDASFYIGDTGYLIRPDEIKNLEIKLGTSVYRMGIGGLHSSEKTMAVVADENRLLIDRDVRGYYPQIVLNCELAPKNLGLSFLVVYQNLVSRRLEAKRLENLAVSENLKVAVNGTFGKTGNPYSILYAPDVIVQILLCGQLYLLMLIEMLEINGIPVISGNTDGCLMNCPVEKRQVMLNTIKEWEKITGFETEESLYKAVYARDVNAYLAIKTDGSVKGKNIYYDPWRIGSSAKDQYWRFQKNPTCQICVEAVELLITKGVPIEQTIRQCTDITRFVAIKNVTGGAHWNGDYLGKVVRWYYANGATGTINYIKSNRIVADTEGAVPLMDLPDELPSDINYDYYMQRCKDLLTDMGATV